MDTIEHLKQTLGPVLLNGMSKEKNYDAALVDIFGLSAVYFADKDIFTAVKDFLAQPEFDAAHILEKMIPESKQRDALLAKLANVHQLEAADAHDFFAKTIHLIVEQMTILAGDKAVPEFLAEQAQSLVGAIPAWSHEFLPANILSLFNITPVVKKPVETVVPSPAATPSEPQQTENEEESKPFPVIAFLIVAALAWIGLKSCNNKTTEAPKNEEAVATVSVAQLALSSTEEHALDRCWALVGDEALKERVHQALTAVFQEQAANCAIEIRNTVANQMPAAEQIEPILTMVRDTAGAAAYVEEKAVHVMHADQAVADKLIADLKAAAPDFTVDYRADIPAFAPAEETATTEMQAVEVPAEEAAIPDENQAAVIVENDKLVFYFAQEQAELAENASEIAAELLQQVQGKKLVITGDTADAELAQKRAKAVKTFLIEKGISPAQIEIVTTPEKAATDGKGRLVEVAFVAA